MTFSLPIADVRAAYPAFTIVKALTPSAQKAAFHARDSSGKDVCLKIISPNYNIDRLGREILALQKINHPNIVRLLEYQYHVSSAGIRHYMVEEFVDGSDLEALLTGKLPTATAFPLFAQIADGLSELRKQDIVHRDIKPENIRVRPDGRPVIIDFGVARHLGMDALTRTSQGAALGTPLYFAPEQYTGTKYDIDHRTDLFALGTILYRAVCGEQPFLRPGMTDIAQLQDLVCNSTDHETKPSFLALSAPAQLLLKKLLSKDRAGRPQDAAQVAMILRKLL